MNSSLLNGTLDFEIDLQYIEDRDYVLYCAGIFLGGLVFILICLTFVVFCERRAIRGEYLANIYNPAPFDALFAKYGAIGPICQVETRENEEGEQVTAL